MHGLPPLWSMILNEITDEKDRMDRELHLLTSINTGNIMNHSLGEPHSADDIQFQSHANIGLSKISHFYADNNTFGSSSNNGTILER